jgi:hypothetical protein
LNPPPAVDKLISETNYMLPSRLAAPVAKTSRTF